MAAIHRSGTLTGRLEYEGEWAGWYRMNGDPFVDLVGPFYYQEVEDGSPVYGMKVEHRHLNGGGVMHGGALATFIDCALFAFAHTVTRQRMVTLSLRNDFIAPALHPIFCLRRSGHSSRSIWFAMYAKPGPIRAVRAQKDCLMPNCARFKTISMKTLPNAGCGTCECAGHERTPFHAAVSHGHGRNGISLRGKTAFRESEGNAGDRPALEADCLPPWLFKPGFFYRGVQTHIREIASILQEEIFPIQHPE